MTELVHERKTGGAFAFSAAQETGNSITHGLGAALSAAALAALVVGAVRRGDAWHVASYAVFGSSMVTLYLASTLYHAFRSPRLKRVF